MLTQSVSAVSLFGSPLQSLKIEDNNSSKTDKYSQLSLSRLRLSRITAYLEEKSGPCYNTEI